MLLRIYVSQRRIGKKDQIGHLLRTIMLEKSILRPDTSIPSLEILAFSLQGSQNNSASDTVFHYIDTCVLRFVKKAVHYHDSFDNLIMSIDPRVDPQNASVDLLLLTLVEQWPFLSRGASPSDLVSVAQWMILYIDLLQLTGGNKKFLSQMRKDFASDDQSTQSHVPALEASGQTTDQTLYEQLRNFVEPGAVASTKRHDSKVARTSQHLNHRIVPPGPPEEEDNHPGLLRWRHENVQDAIANGALEDLVVCLSSKHQSVRQQALQNLLTFMAKLEVSRLPKVLELLR